MDLIKVMKCLADPKRLHIVQLLSARKYCVRALSRELGISEAAVSQHIRLMKEAGLLIMGEKNGYNVHYAVNAETFQFLSESFSTMAKNVKSERQCNGRCRLEARARVKS